MVLPPRTLIDVDPDSSATFQLPDGATLTLQGGTIITIEELTPSGGQARIMVRVAMGAIIYRHQADARGRFARSDFMVRINDGVYSTRGTAFSLKFDPNSGMVTLSLTDGQLEFDPGHGLQKMLLDAPTTMTMSVKH
jgi:ferric-dicitrate binding protein FerR (iron transport regulator)